MDAIVNSLPRNFMHDIARDTKLVAPERCLMQAPLADDVPSAHGNARLGILVTLVDVAGSDPALAACRPDWTATQDLSVHAATKPVTEGPVVIDARLLRLGKKAITVSADIYDGHGIGDLDELQSHIDAGAAGAVTLAGRSLLTYARISPRAATRIDADAYNPANWVGKLRQCVVEHSPAGTMNERMGIGILDAENGVVEVERTGYVANASGTVNGGAQGLIFEVAAEAMLPGFVATDIEIRYLAPTKKGPTRTSGTLCRIGDDHCVASLRLLDAGAGDRLLTLATVTLQKLAA